MHGITPLNALTDSTPYDLFFQPQANQVTGLSSQEIAHFGRKGWAGAFPLLTPAGVKRATDAYGQVADLVMPEHLLPTLHRNDAFAQRPWAKSLHAYIPEYQAIVSHPAIVNRVASLLGPDLIAWGLSVAVRQPGQKHRWHIDIEHHRWPGITVFIGLTGSTANSSLNVISGSHHTKAIPQFLKIESNKAALAKACRLGATCELETVVTQEGEFFMFDGLLWHGSANQSFSPRTALIAQYARPDARIEVPLTWNEPIRWLPASPPCVLVSGQDRFGINRIVAS